jgi:hypothetical protein
VALVGVVEAVHTTQLLALAVQAVTALFIFTTKEF